MVATQAMQPVHSAESVKQCIVMVSKNAQSYASMWEGVAELAKLRAGIQKATGMSSLPPVVLQPKPAEGNKRIAIVARCAFDAKATDLPDETICSGSTADEVHGSFAGTVSPSNSLVFKATKDWPGALAEVSALFVAHGANILEANIVTDSDTQEAVHTYKVADATTGLRLNDETIHKIEASFKILRDADSGLRHILASPPPSDLTRLPDGKDDTVITSGKDISVCLAGESPWELAVKAKALRDCIRQSFRGEAPPPVILSGSCGQPPVSIVVRNDGAENVFCSGTTIESVQTEFSKKFGTINTIIFETDADRAGLLSEVSSLFSMHGADIKNASITTEQGTMRAKHVYQVADAKTGERLSSGVVCRLESDLQMLRDADSALRRLLAERLRARQS